jgi:hypothetical protein
MMTVNIGDEDFIVSTNDIDACLSAIKPNIIENNLNPPTISISRQKLSLLIKMFK